MWTFAAKSPAEFNLKQAKMTLADCAHLISCPTLVIDSDAEQFFGGQPKKLYDALKCPKTYMAQPFILMGKWGESCYCFNT
jgi:hypothetical protein